MSDPKGATLYVNVGASQARRRLKGFGHGVRQVQSAGKHRAVIVHTATGRHLEELRGKFADVGCSAHERDLSEPVDNLRNLGPTSCDWLRAAGIRTIADLRSMGPVTAFRLVRAKQPRASFNLLWALAAGLEDRDWRGLSDEEKSRRRADAIE